MRGITRRDWVFAGACWADLLRAQQNVPRFAYFDRATAVEIEAIAETIIPEDGTPGARETGVIWFIDRALAGRDEDKRSTYRQGLADLQSKRASLYPGSRSIAELTPAERIALLKQVETTDFFRAVRLHTILGFFGNPKHGGNRDFASSKLLGIERSMHFEPPFGYYDGEASK